ncbi:MAG: signal peptide peptidase SppA [Dehalococcoidia bacterium]|nr:signal peptide peptidase SppA [Dehalococcoidia bacterium]
MLDDLLAQVRPPVLVVVDLQGVIGQAIRPLDTARMLMKLREDRGVQGVLLNIDSPGGSAGGSEMITRAAHRLREVKPVVAFVGTIGASGGYMLASAAEHIVAQPSALLGSIGVIAYRPLVYEALSRVGVRMDVAKSGRLKDMLSPFREPTTEEKAKEQELLDDMYNIFVDGVAQSRRLDLEDARALATGEVYTARQALTHRLIDSVGDLDDAIDWLVARTGAPRKVRNVRPKRSLREMLMNRNAMASMAPLGAIGTMGGPLGAFASVLGELGHAAEGGYYYLYTGPTGGR